VGDDRSTHRVSGDATDALLRSSFVGIIEGAGDEIRAANDAFLHMTGYTRGDLELGALRWPDLTPLEWAASDDTAYDQLVATGEQVPIEKEYLRRDGSRVPVLVHAIATSAGGWVAIVVDLSARRDVSAAIRLGERRYRSLAEATNAIVWRSTPASANA
jgi:PAS domain S-box-containing protein